MEEVSSVPFEEPLVCPLLKKPLLIPIILDNFYPVSEILFLGKVVGKMVSLQLQRILEEMNSLVPFQFSFRPIFGKEIALVTVMDDLWWEWNGDSILALLDF